MKANSELSMPQYLEFPVKNKESFQRLLPRLQLNQEKRFPGNWMEKCARWEKRIVPLSVNADREGGFFGPLRNLMGLEMRLIEE